MPKPRIALIHATPVAIEAARDRVAIPVLKPTEAMLDEALAAGANIGLLATFAPSIPSMLKELEDLAHSRSLRITVTPPGERF